LIWEVLLIALIVQLPAVREAFGITLPSVTDLVLVSVIGLVLMSLIEATKVLLRRHRQSAAAL
jgi:hypothetical protein